MPITTIVPRLAALARARTATGTVIVICNQWGTRMVYSPNQLAHYLCHMWYNYKLENLPVGLSIYTIWLLLARYRFLSLMLCIIPFNLTSKLVPLQTSESTSEVDPEKVTRIWILHLSTCIASYGSAVGSGEKHLVIVRTFNMSTSRNGSSEQRYIPPKQQQVMFNALGKIIWKSSSPSLVKRTTRDPPQLQRKTWFGFLGSFKSSHTVHSKFLLHHRHINHHSTFSRETLLQWRPRKVGGFSALHQCNRRRKSC